MRLQPSLQATVVAVLGLVALTPVSADELTRRVQTDLVALGYQPGNTTGEATVDTTVAIAKFQAEHDLAVSGEVTPVLAGILAAEVDKRAALESPASARPARTAEELAEMRQTCIEEKIAEAERSQRKRQGLGRIASAVSRVASRAGNSDVSRAVGDANVAADAVGDVTQAARDLGVAQSEIEACDHPE
jgi:peptidoglycan hydrolase-like protein with peptidoglycan-binding domain